MGGCEGKRRKEGFDAAGIIKREFMPEDKPVDRDDGDRDERKRTGRSIISQRDHFAGAVVSREGRSGPGVADGAWAGVNTSFSQASTICGRLLTPRSISAPCRFPV